jgi:DNA-binding LytR/AlgR family response regulator
MLSILALDTLTNEEQSVSGILKEGFAARALPIKRLTVYTSLERLRKEPERAEQYNVLILAVWEAREADMALALAKGLRKYNDDMFIVFVLAGGADIGTLITPSVRPSGVLFIPPEKDRVYATVREIYAEYRRRSALAGGSKFTVKTGGEQIYVKASDIFFFESKDKKIALRTRGQEITFYSTLGAVLEQLPDGFIRCHKGFVVNIYHVSRANFADMNLTLTDGSVIPVSRSYRQDVTAALEGLNH